MTARGNPTAISVQPLEDYRLLLTFENQETRVFNMKPLLEGKAGTWYGELLDSDYFNQVKIGGGSVEWPNEQDVYPDCLFENSLPFEQDIMMTATV